MQDKNSKAELTRLPSGDIVYRYKQSIVVVFWGKRRVLSTSIYNGGYHEDLEAIFNQDGTTGAPDYRYRLLADTYLEHMQLAAKDLGLLPYKVSGMGTAAQMENVAIRTMEHNGVCVTAIVTGGIEKNGGRVGDPAPYDELMQKEAPGLGTINIMLFFNVKMPPGIIARALVTCTEAKTAALQELMAGSCFSHGIATGSGTDQTMVVAMDDAPLTVEEVGKHSKYGELIGKVVKEAVKEALSKQYPFLTAKSQHDILQRLKRYGVTEETVWDCACSISDKAVDKARFLKLLRRVAKRSDIVTSGALYIHLFDELDWDLLSYDEVESMSVELVENLAEKYNIDLTDTEQVHGKLLWEMENFLAQLVLNFM